MSAVALATAKEFLQISHTAQDTVVQVLIDGAEDWIERACGIKLTSTGCEEDLDGGEEYLWPTYRPVTEINSVTDNWNSDEEYDALLAGDGRIQRADADGLATDNVKWPSGSKRWHVTYQAGEAALPSALQLAILNLVYRAYYARGGQAGGAVAGASANFAVLAGSDIAAAIAPFKRRRVAMI